MQRKMAQSFFVLLATVLTAGSICSGAQNVTITFDENDPRVAFAAAAIKKALADAGYAADAKRAEMRIAFEIYETGIGPQGFRIRREGDNVIRIVGGDSCGAMYGGLELAEMITLGGSLDAVQEKARKPYLARRGLKFNIPFDARSPSYDDTGTAAHKNIPVMWEFSFWRKFLDTLHLPPASGQARPNCRCLQGLRRPVQYRPQIRPRPALFDRNCFPGPIIWTGGNGSKM